MLTRHLLNTLAIIAVMIMLGACNKAPKGVISESDMTDLLVDLCKAEAYTQIRSADFPDDSSMMVLKQSVFEKHGVTPELYDKSLEWYAHNMDVYTDVYDKAIKKLRDEQAKTDRTGGPSRTEPTPDVNPVPQQRPMTVGGDTANIWQGPAQWTLTHALTDSYLPFDFQPDQDTKSGDRYELNCKLTGVGASAVALVAVDYGDGATSIVTRNKLSNGWTRIVLQADTARIVTRIYGYFRCQVPRDSYLYLDSISMIRTHFDARNFGAFARQVLYERRQAPAPRSVTTAAPPAIPDNRQRFKPKEGVNKSSVQPHVVASPNATHMPSKRE